MTQQELAKFARFINQPVEVARQIIEQEELKHAHHSSRNVHDGYDYGRQAWCECDYCNRQDTTSQSQAPST